VTGVSGFSHPVAGMGVWGGSPVGHHPAAVASLHPLTRVPGLGCLLVAYPPLKRWALICRPSGPEQATQLTTDPFGFDTQAHHMKRKFGTPEASPQDSFWQGRDHKLTPKRWARTRGIRRFICATGYRPISCARLLVSNDPASANPCVSFFRTPRSDSNSMSTCPLLWRAQALL
jgi:hypothetical protein